MSTGALAEPLQKRPQIFAALFAALNFGFAIIRAVKPKGIFYRELVVTIKKIFHQVHIG